MFFHTQSPLGITSVLGASMAAFLIGMSGVAQGQTITFSTANQGGGLFTTDPGTNIGSVVGAGPVGGRSDLYFGGTGGNVNPSVVTVPAPFTLCLGCSVTVSGEFYSNSAAGLEGNDFYLWFGPASTPPSPPPSGPFNIGPYPVAVEGVIVGGSTLANHALTVIDHQDAVSASTRPLNTTGDPAFAPPVDTWFGFTATFLRNTDGRLLIASATVQPEGGAAADVPALRNYALSGTPAWLADSTPLNVGLLVDDYASSITITQNTQHTLSVTAATTTPVLTPGGTVAYSFGVNNSSSVVDALGVGISYVVPAGLSNAQWTCTATGGAVCPAATGSGDLNIVGATLAAGGTLTYAFTADVAATPPASVTNTVTVDRGNAACSVACNASSQISATPPPVVAPAAIPTLNEWMLLLTSALLGLFVVGGLRRGKNR